MASTYVPVDSWVYPAFELLAAKGYVQSAFFDLRPWTRLDCPRLIEEADDLTADQPISNEVAATLRSLKQGFAWSFWAEVTCRISISLRISLFITIGNCSWKIRWSGGDSFYSRRNHKEITHSLFSFPTGPLGGRNEY
jgi:hypothetical protein